MLSFFPVPYPDELLYGLISRYHEQSGNVDYWQTVQELFGNKRAHSSVVLPSRLGELARRIEHFGLSFDELLMRQTLYPYYTVFSSNQNADWVYTWAKESCEGASRRYLGTFGNQEYEPQHLRFCPQCYAEEQEQYGEGFWHRLHQTPGVLVCERHHCVLMESTVPYLSKGSNEYLPAKISRLFPAIHPPTFSDKGRQQAIQLTNDILFLYGSYKRIRAAFSKHGYSFRMLFIRLLRAKGLATDGGALRLTAFRQAFLNFYASELLAVLGFIFDDSVSRPWIVSMCRNNKVMSHPLRYILLARFLCGSLTQLIQHAVEYSPEELNNISPRHYGQPDQFEKKLTAYRKRWSKACSKMPDAPQNEIRATAPSVYTWLNRHDKAWLVEHPKVRQRLGGNKTFADWDERDTEYSEKVQLAAEKLRRKVGKPVQITKTKLFNAIGCGAIPKEKQERLPQTINAITREVETRQEFQLRRVCWAAEELTIRGEPPVKWRVLKLACIRTEQWDEFWKLYQREIEAE